MISERLVLNTANLLTNYSQLLKLAKNYDLPFIIVYINFTLCLHVSKLDDETGKYDRRLNKKLVEIFNKSEIVRP